MRGVENPSGRCVPDRYSRQEVCVPLQQIGGGGGGGGLEQLVAEKRGVWDDGKETVQRGREERSGTPGSSLDWS